MSSSLTRAASYTLPSHVKFVRKTAVFTQQTVPQGLLRAHQISANSWGRLVVESGSLKFTFESDPPDVRELKAGESQVIPPSIAHHIAPDAEARFAVEFYKTDK